MASDKSELSDCEWNSTEGSIEILGGSDAPFRCGLTIDRG